MSYKFRTIPSFERDLKRLVKRYPSLKEDMFHLMKQLQENPRMGTSLGHGVHKIRLSLTSKSKGKKGGARVITHADVMLEMKEGTICFLALYDKGEQETISEKRIKYLLGEAGIK